MTKESLILFCEVVKKWLRDSEPYAWGLMILVMIVLTVFGWWWVGRRTRHLALRPRYDEVYQALMNFLGFLSNNGFFSGPHWTSLDKMVNKPNFLFKGKMKVFLTEVLKEGRKFQGQGQVVEGKKWATEQEKEARRLFRKMLKV
jgi:hypothetical protein